MRLPLLHLQMVEIMKQFIMLEKNNSEEAEKETDN